MIFNIVTFHDAVNHGAVLQAYALQHFIESLGYEAGIFDYRSPGIASLKGQAARMVRLLYRRDYAEKARRFREFSGEKLKLNQEKSAPVFIAGSDQVWNPDGLMDPAYFLRIFSEDSIRASYAASLGVQKIPEDRKADFARYLSDFDAVSVRETEAKEAIGCMYAGSIEVHADPVLLFDRDFWIREARAVEGIPENYIFVYALRPARCLNRLIRWLQRETGAKVVMIDEQGFIAWRVRHDIVKRNIGPGEFLWLTAHARAVISTSFHGCAFSLVFHKELYPVIDPEKPARVENLTRMFGIEGIAENASVFRRADRTDWETVDRKLREEREKSRSYIECLYLKTQIGHEKKANIRQLWQNCTGCGCCREVCPENAVAMKRSPEGGFMVPEIREALCTGCGSCLQVCPAVGKNNHLHPPQKAACAWHRDPRALLQSTSGGVFRALAEEVISAGGIVFGVKYTDGYRGTVYTSSDESRLEEMQGSKYVAPDPAGIAARVEKALKEHRLVLFSGAPCHVAGLKNTLGEQENLITCDFVCRGMPAPDAFREHLHEMEKKAASPVGKIEFRSKSDGWNRSKVRYHFRSGRTVNIRKGFRDTFYHCFALSHVNVRECCTDCLFAEAHAADITMGDYWNYRFSGIPRNSGGMSLVLANTEKGVQMMEKLKDRMEILPLKPEEGTIALRKPEDPDRNRRERNSYFSTSERLGYEAAAKRYAATGYLPNLLMKLKHMRRSSYVRIRI